MLSPICHACLNAPYDALCFLTQREPAHGPVRDRLNAPYGALCFLTVTISLVSYTQTQSLNAPYGALCFLTHVTSRRFQVDVES